MAFVHAQKSEKPAATDLCILVQGDRLLVKQGGVDRVHLPLVGELGNFAQSFQTQSLGKLADAACWFAGVAEADAVAPTGCEWLETRGLLPLFTPEQMQAVSCARELHWWQARNRFCGCCGTPTVDVGTEKAKKCPHCATMFFPAAFPAIIVAVTRGDEILLAHNSHFRPQMHSLLAGFVDPGETLEQAAIREVREEVGIEIANPRYLSSQPWPFPNSLMLGFRAEYVCGEVVVDGKEIETARWFKRDQLPEIPRPGTVARAIIDAWVNE